MAEKKSNPVTRSLSILIRFATIIWFSDRNRARPTGDYGKTQDLQESFSKKGWLQDEDGTVKVTKLTPELIERGMRERQERWTALQNLAKQDSTKLVDLAVFEELYVENGKLIPIEFEGVSGNRRDRAHFPAMVERKKANLPLTVDVPVIVRTYSSLLERLMDQAGENQNKTLGFKLPGDVDNLLVAKEAVELGATQADIRDVFKDGTGQKLWGVIVLDGRFPDLGIVKRMTLKPEEDGYIRLASVKFADMPALVLRTDPKALEEKNQKLVTQGKEPLKPASQEDIAKYFTDGKPAGNETKVMKGDNIRGLATNFPVRALQRMATAIAENNVDILKPYQVANLGFNALDAFIESGDYPAVEYILVKLLQAKEQRGNLIAALTKVCDGK